MAGVLEALVGELDCPMFIVTTAAAGRRAGCLVGFATQCSIHPARLLVCLSKRNYTFRVAADAEALAVHFPGEGDKALSHLFGEQTGDDLDKFARSDWSAGPGDLPVLDVERGWIAGRVLARHDLGDHVGYLLEPFAGQVRTPAAAPLGFQQVRHMPPGHEA